MPIHPWRSARLVYTAIEAEDDDFLLSIPADAESYFNASPFPVVPQAKSDVAGNREYYRDKCLLAVKICLLAPQSSQDSATAATDAATSKPIPIGTIALSASDPKQVHHRNSGLGICILRQHQGQGYGSEAIRWALQWGFRYGNLHRIELGVFGWNPGALRLYERLGFVRESCKREHLWYDGKYWDLVELGMLECEWREKYGDEDSAVAGAKKSSRIVTKKS
ncbi:hypothetical protein LTR36_009527 [Oleoguttula mirabilis]|uniref:N-acetyltransferase domain-containing protein n=1 Tax=Oleoguttula mirabilis TaxID=1507867 RepID=A0AAV9JSH2_9PEZI|nr:hypothetical protein LTR36_009527 [Oleoguttula mirabilis]